MKSPTGPYWVYENFPNNKSVGHTQICPFFKLHGGEAPRTGKWHGPFATKEAAELAALATARPFHWCPSC